VHELIEAKDEKRLLRYQKQMAGYQLLIVDELGFVPLSKSGAELLFEIFSQRYERSSTVVTSNLIYPLLNGRRCCNRNGSRERCWIASPTMFTFWR
jgi:DNA replication protein DnaC